MVKVAWLVPRMLVSNSVSKLGVGTALPCAEAFRPVTSGVRSTAPSTSAVVGASMAATEAANPTQVFLLGINLPIAGSLSESCHYVLVLEHVGSQGQEPVRV